MATIQLWDPFRELLRIDDAVGRPWRRSAVRSQPQSWVLPVDVREDENAVEVAASLPGFAKDDIDVSVENGRLTIRAETSDAEDAQETEHDGYVVRERRSGSFYRTLRLSDRVDAAATTSRYTDGVLTVTIPKREESKPKRIEVAVA